MDWFSWVVVPVLIFCSRVADVSLGTLRLIYLSRGYRGLAPLVGFFEVLIWIVAVREVMINMRNVACVLAYAGGYAMGSYVGMRLEERLAIGKVLLRVVFRLDPEPFLVYMRQSDLGFTLLDGQGIRQHVKILMAAINGKDLKRVLEKLSETHPKAFYTFDRVRTVSEGVFPVSGRQGLFLRRFRNNMRK